MSKGNPKAKPTQTPTPSPPPAPVKEEPKPVLPTFEGSFGEWSSSTSSQPKRLTSFKHTGPTHKPRLQERVPVPNTSSNMDVIFPMAPPPALPQSAYSVSIKREPPAPTQSASLGDFISHPTAVPPKPKVIVPKKQTSELL